MDEPADFNASFWRDAVACLRQLAFDDPNAAKVVGFSQKGFMPPGCANAGQQIASKN
jgi:hypothetical protein